MLHEFYDGKRVFITGHNGFKGTWICKVLTMFGANVKGFSLHTTQPSFYDVLSFEGIENYIGDIRNYNVLKKEIHDFKPDIIIHLAAQALVGKSYENPITTYETNIMGTINVMEAIRDCSSIKSCIMVTTDKVYENKEWCWGYRENDVLNGKDPYSNSKSCADLIIQSYHMNFLPHIPVSICRAGNVIGGGDFSENRILPDCFKSVQSNMKINIRNPQSIRPYQHVLEPVMAYLIIAKKQYEDQNMAGIFNIGPDDESCISTETLVELFCHYWKNGASWEASDTSKFKEANFLKLDSSKFRLLYDWNPVWNIEEAMKLTVEGYQAFLAPERLHQVMEGQIHAYLLGMLK